MAFAIGIDFGTTNSLCTWLDGDKPSLIPNSRGERSTPSVVAISPSGQVLVGESAKNQAILNPESTVAGIKRLLGSEGRLSLGGRSWRVEEIVAFVLGSLRKDAERYLEREVGAAVITAPAHFSERERRALVEAGSIAGLEVLRVVNEPTAAAVARSWNTREAEAKGTVLVYDFGGGTLDVTVLSQTGRECRVLASRGDGRLGGADLDAELCRLAASAFRRDYGLEPDSDRILSQTLADAAERAKIELSEREEATIGIPFAVVGAVDGRGGRVVNPSLTVTRPMFEEIALPYVERSLRLAELALAEAGLEASQVDALVLSGGSSRIPLVRRLIAERFGLRAEGRVSPAEIVALGAAAWTGILAGSERLKVIDVVSRTYGVEIDGGLFVPLIRKNSPVPASSSRIFTTVADGQDSVEIHVLQGESREAGLDLSLGRFLLTGIAAAPKGKPRIRVDFGIDESDILHVSALDLDTGKAQAISIADLDREGEGKDGLLRKTAALAERLEALRKGLVLERGLEAELDELCERARAAALGPVAEDELRLLKVELESLVGELLARGAERGGR
ncbi:MAG TPA: Hsp70 family protein [Rectinemataceae bacterium]|nr:Hsp70 family protein [Rectinemataceae bacterium]